MREVLVAVDGSSWSEAAVPHAVELARRLDVPLRLLFAARPTSARRDDQPRHVDMLEANYLARVANRARRMGAATAWEVLHGEPLAALLDRATEGTVIVITVPEPRPRAVGNPSSQRIAAELIRRCPVPVLLTPPPPG